LGFARANTSACVLSDPSTAGFRLPYVTLNLCRIGADKMAPR